MKLIQRSLYLDQLKSIKGTPDIKAITGVRRSGKSRLMEQYIEWIRSNEPEANIISIDLTNLRYESLKEYHALNNYIEDHYENTKENYLFVDEVQLCPNFELTINSLHSSGKYDIYVTGSNAFLLSGDLATFFTGRTYEVEVYPFSFSKYMEYFKPDDIQTAFDQYIKVGGMSGAYPYKEQDERYKYNERCLSENTDCKDKARKISV